MQSGRRRMLIPRLRRLWLARRRSTCIRWGANTNRRPTARPLVPAIFDWSPRCRWSRSFGTCTGAVPILGRPVPNIGARGPILSTCFRDPDYFPTALQSCMQESAHSVRNKTVLLVATFRAGALMTAGRQRVVSRATQVRDCSAPIALCCRATAPHPIRETRATRTLLRLDIISL